MICYERKEWDCFLILSILSYGFVTIRLDLQTVSESSVLILQTTKIDSLGSGKNAWKAG